MERVRPAKRDILLQDASRKCGQNEKYGVSQSALLAMLVHDRWLAEKSGGVGKRVIDPGYYDRGDLDFEAVEMGKPGEVVKKSAGVVGSVGSGGLVRSGGRKRHK